MTTIPHETPTAILPAVDKPPFSQKKGQAGSEGTPHRPLLPERLESMQNYESKKKCTKKSKLYVHWQSLHSLVYKQILLQEQLAICDNAFEGSLLYYSTMYTN